MLITDASTLSLSEMFTLYVPRIDDTMDVLVRARYFTTLNLASGKPALYCPFVVFVVQSMCLYLCK